MTYRSVYQKIPTLFILQPLPEVKLISPCPMPYALFLLMTNSKKSSEDFIAHLVDLALNLIEEFVQADLHDFFNG